MVSVRLVGVTRMIYRQKGGSVSFVLFMVHAFDNFGETWEKLETFLSQSPVTWQGKAHEC